MRAFQAGSQTSPKCAAGTSCRRLQSTTLAALRSSLACRANGLAWVQVGMQLLKSLMKPSLDAPDNPQHLCSWTEEANVAWSMAQLLLPINGIVIWIAFANHCSMSAPCKSGSRSVNVTSFESLVPGSCSDSRQLCQCSQSV